MSEYPDFDICSVLAIIEFVINNCFAQAVMVVAMRAIASDRYLHGNFKFVMCMTLSRTFLNSFRRTVANYLTFFWTYDLSPGFLYSYKYLSMFTSTLLSISMPFVAIDRLLYTYNFGNYEARKASACSLFCCATIVIALSIGISVFDKSMIPLSFKFFSPVVTLILMAIVYRANQKRRHSQISSSLDDKAIARINMNSVVLFLLPMTCASLFSIITAYDLDRRLDAAKICFVLRRIWIFGYNSVMGLALPFDNFLTPSIAYLCHRYLTNRNLARVHCKLGVFSSKSNEHFKQLEKSWRMTELY